MVDTVSDFAGSIPDYYDTSLGPAWFDAFGADLVQRLPERPPGDVLETACGTGIVTRRLRDRLDPTIRLVATDLSKPMLNYARYKHRDRKDIEWQEADATKLPFEDGTFGAVVCAFGVIFCPDKLAVFREARRVLKKGGIFLFNVWDRIEENPHAVVTAALMERLFPGDAEMQFSVPFEMYDPELLQRFLDTAGFLKARIETKRVEVEGLTAHKIALGYIRGTTRSALIEKRGVSLAEMVDMAAAEFAKIGGADPYRGHASAVVVEAYANG